MTQIDDLLQEFPDDSRQVVSALWRSLPGERRDELLALLPIMPGQPGKIQKLFELAHKQLQMSFGNRRNVAIVGPANVGKSTLYNALLANDADRAAVSPVPGTTRHNQEANAGPFTVVDTPGADAVGAVGQRERDAALEAARKADFLIVLFDAVQGVKRTERALFRELQVLRKPFVVVLNKMDLIAGSDRQAVTARAAENLGLKANEIIPISAKDEENLERVVLAIIKAEPALVAALGRGLPAYRRQLSWRVISGAASTAGVVALTPLPFLDFVPLVGLQVSMVLGLARVYDHRVTLRRAREILGVLGGGFLARTAFYELIKIGGPPAWVIAAAVAAGTTVSMGYAAMVWFERGERLSTETTKQVARTVVEHTKESLKSIGRDQPSRQKLRERIHEAIDDI
jgi:small GTP-binding protein